MPFIRPLKAEFVPLSDNIKLTAELSYWCPRTKQLIVVPKGFISDCASIPRLLWPIIGQPFDWRWRKESVLHDFLYRTNGQIVTRKVADQIFYDALREGGLRYTKAKAMYLGVRLFGWLPWGNNQGEKT